MELEGSRILHDGHRRFDAKYYMDIAGPRIAHSQKESTSVTSDKRCTDKFTDSPLPCDEVDTASDLDA